jgi:hypothetical protein
MVDAIILGKLATDLGLHVTGHFLYDKLKEVFSQSEKINKEELKQELGSYLYIENANIVAEKIIQFLADEGDIDIKGSEIYAKKSLLYSSKQNTSFSLENSKSFTDKTGVILNNGKIIGVNGGGMSQNEDGSISFRA